MVSAARIGALRVDLGVNTAAFQKGLTRAERRLQYFGKRMQRVGSEISGFGKKLTVGATTPILAAGAAFATAAHQMAGSAREMATSSQIAGESFEEFQRQAYAAKTVGIEFEKLGDQFKDVRERVGEFVVTGAGPLQDAFDALNGKVKLTVDELRGLSGRDALQLIVNRMEEAKLSTEEMSFVLESLASDTTNLLPLLRDGGKAFDELGAKAAVISDEDRENFEKYTQAQAQLAEATKKLTIALVNSGILETVTRLVEKFAEWTANLAETNPTLLKVGVAAAAVAAAVGPLVMGIGGLVSAAGTLIPAMGGIVAAAGPVGVAIAAAAAIAVTLYQNWDRISPLFDKVRASLGRFKAAVEEVFGPDVWAKVQEFGKVVMDVIGDGVVRVLTTYVNYTVTVLDAISTLATEGARWFRWLADGVNMSVGELKDSLWSVLNPIGTVKDAFFGMYDAVVGNSYVPDMVDGIEYEFSRLQHVMVDPAIKATQTVEGAARDMAFEVQAILARLFPEMARAAQQASEIATLRQAEKDGIISSDMRLAGVRGIQLERIGVGPLREAREVETAMVKVGDATDELADKTDVATVRIAKSFGDMAQETMRHLRGLADAIKGGGFWDIVDAVIGIGLQLAGAGVFGQGAASAVNSVPRYAMGTNFHPGGLAIVGERGPELVNMPRGSQVMTNQALRAANSNGGTVNNFYTLPSDEFWSRVDGRAADVVGMAAPSIAREGAGQALRQMSRANSRALA